MLIALTSSNFPFIHSRVVKKSMERCLIHVDVMQFLMSYNRLLSLLVHLTYQSIPVAFYAHGRLVSAVYVLYLNDLLWLGNAMQGKAI